ncbi:uncharacterized protein LOC131242722 [Magnolia sinica]|uniref:uncharacterized protein LOC131242722 n=1 Tax=Magnolia sinica TaxID=86752 RepID=UPI0026582388|nr:uncharacterized protein LOC131242722 [Magnolia sinica]
MNGYEGDSDGDDERGLIWRLPVLKLKELGKLGPALGYGAGCGFGVGVGLLGGVGLGAGIPGLQFGFGLGAGCGIGLGFGYGAGRGVAYDENQKYTNVGKLFHGTGNLPSQDEISSLMNEMVRNTKRLIKVTSKEIDKWRR